MCKTCKGKCLLNIEEEPFEAYSEIDETNEPFDAYSEFDNETDYLQEIEDGDSFFEFYEEGAPFDTETIDSEWLAEVNRNSKEYIRWVQRLLNQIMGLRLAEDGIKGAQTRSAIRSFQQKQGLIVDGNVGPNTEAALIKATGGRVPEPGMTMPTDTIKPAAARLKHFDKNSAKLKDFHAPEIDRVADRVAVSWRTGQPIFTIYVKGHTSSEGPAQYNIGLGNHRALAVRKALQKALERKQKNLSYKVLILAQSKGAKEPIDTNATEEGRSQNRRVEIFLSTKALAPLPKKKPPSPEKKRDLICPPSVRPHICVQPNSIGFWAKEGSSDRLFETFAIQNSAPSSLNWSIWIEKTSKRSWLSVTPTAGVFGEDPQRINVIAEPKGLPKGNYFATIRISAPGADNSPQKVTVHLRVEAWDVIEPIPRRRLVATGIWRTGSTEYVAASDQRDVMRFQLKNIGTLPANVAIRANNGEQKQVILAPFGASADLTFLNPIRGFWNWQFWVNNSLSIPTPAGGGTQITWRLYAELP